MTRQELDSEGGDHQQEPWRTCKDRCTKMLRVCDSQVKNTERKQRRVPGPPSPPKSTTLGLIAPQQLKLQHFNWMNDCVQRNLVDRYGVKRRRGNTESRQY